MPADLSSTRRWPPSERESRRGGTPWTRCDARSGGAALAKMNEAVLAIIQSEDHLFGWIARTGDLLAALSGVGAPGAGA